MTLQKIASKPKPAKIDFGQRLDKEATRERFFKQLNKLKENQIQDIHKD
jgi:hypothetical protein